MNSDPRIAPSTDPPSAPHSSGIAPDRYLLTGSSGSGNGRLFEAHTGELDYTGSARLECTELRNLSTATRRQHLYLAGRCGRALSDKLEHNLRIAARIADRLNTAARDRRIIVATHRRPASLQVRETLTCMSMNTAQRSPMDEEERA